MKAEVKTLDNEAAGEIELAEAVFGLAARPDILHRVVTWQLAKRQQGTHKTKQRSEINRTSKKVYKQKGTGRARHGNRRAPIFRGGGITFGPQVRSHAIELPKKVRALGLKCALSAKQAAGELAVLDGAQLAEPKTKALASKLAKFGWRNVLIIDGPGLDENLQLAARNLPNVDLLPCKGANVYDILRRHQLVLTRAAVAELEARLA
ncbi:MAG: 50S ribosomal protein L4 [Alphaproteobacteria bacterium]|nr:50S ribosomal protein L4 [Alphaproteobacteria bacterium]